MFGYLLGSIPFGLLLTRAAGLGDVRKIGSGNIGATNVLRTGNKGLAAATLLLDGVKGAAAVLVCYWLLLQWTDSTHYVPTTSAAVFHERVQAEHRNFILAAIAGLGAFLGHLFPVWLGFKGGKGVATFIGVIFALAWPLGLLFCVVWLIVAAVTRLSSLAALAATIAAVAAAFVGGGNFTSNRIPLAQPTIIAGVLLFMAILIFWKHRENISRLLAGTESRIGAKG